MRLLQAREEARKIQGKKITFDLIGVQEERLKCQWLNPSEGTFYIEGNTGFCHVNDFLNKDPQVQNIKIGG
jgi:hypothetical protein